MAAWRREGGSSTARSSWSAAVPPTSAAPPLSGWPEPAPRWWWATSRSTARRRWPKKWRRAGGRAIGLLCDVRREESVVAFVERAVTEFGTVDAVDHNAAWSHPRLDTDAVGVDLGVWERAIEITTRGALLLARHAIPVMAAGGGGSIVAISSGTSTIGESTRVAYGVSKAALNQLTRHLAVRYGRDGIRANAIAPGFILTETAATQVPADVQVRLAEANPTRRLGTPDDIARVVVFLCSDDAAYVNGQVLHVDGGHQIAGMM